jgi:hypothetical protein
LSQCIRIIYCFAAIAAKHGSKTINVEGHDIPQGGPRVFLTCCSV